MYDEMKQLKSKQLTLLEMLSQVEDDLTKRIIEKEIKENIEKILFLMDETNH